MTTALIISIISLSLCVLCFFFCRRYIEKKTSATFVLEEYQKEVYRLIAEIDAATDRDSILVEERIKTLKKVIDDTDRRIAVYIKELQKSRDAEAVYTSLGRGIRAALDSSPQSGPLSAQQNAPLSAPLPAPIDKDKKRVKRKKEKKLSQQEEPGLKVQIAQLKAKGLSSQEIASRLNLSIAEVDLALNLLNRH